jgi:TetR/AcrR family hemagglutinin/protease transcriptional regulator
MRFTSNIANILIDTSHNKLDVDDVNNPGYTAAMKPARTRLPPADRRAQLLNHAIACFADHGVARATQAQVAARAGVSVSAVYSYFRTRADLVEAVLQHVAEAIVAMVGAAAGLPGSAEQVLTVLARQTAAMAADQPELVRVWLDWSAGVRAETWPQFVALQSRLHRLVAGILSRHPDADPADPQLASAARLFVGGAHTLALMHFENVSSDRRDIFVGQMVAGALAGMKP